MRRIMHQEEANHAFHLRWFCESCERSLHILRHSGPFSLPA